MKVTFDLPSPVVHRLRASVPSGKRSQFLAALIEKTLKDKGSVLEQAAKRANTLHDINREMLDWEALNEYED